MKIAIVSSTFWPKIVNSLETHCLATLKKHGISEDQITIVHVPGSLEIPLAAEKLAKKGMYDAIIVFGVIHKGKTYHFELIANECARGCMDVSLQYEIPIVFEVLAVYDIQDAIDRATKEEDNRGVKAAVTAIKMITVLEEI